MRVGVDLIRDARFGGDEKASVVELAEAMSASIAPKGVIFVVGADGVNETR